MRSEISRWRRNDVALLHGSRLRRDGGRGVVAATSLYLVIEAALPILNQRIFRAFPYRLTVRGASHLLHRGGAGARQRGVAPAVG